MRMSDWGSDVCSSDLLGDEALAPVLRGAGTEAELVVAAVGHGCVPCKCQRVRSCEARGHAWIGAGFAAHAARRRSRCVPRTPHVQPGLRRGPLPRPFVLPTPFTSEESRVGNECVRT